MDDFSVESPSGTLRFSGRSGALLGFSWHGRELLESACELLTFHLLDESGARLTVNGSEFADFSFSDGLFRFSNHPEYPTISARIALKLEVDAFLFRPAIEGAPAGLRVELVDAPQPHISRGGDLFIPHSEGVVMKASLPEKDDYWMFWSENNYPGICQLQFLAHYENGAGVYFGAHDASHRFKCVGWAVAPDDGLRLRLATYCGDDDPSRYESDFDYVLRGFEGDWRDACDIYREYSEASAPIVPEYPEPSWLDESPVSIVYPVRGDGEIKDGANCYFPYVNAAPHLERLAEAFDSRILAALMRWDCHAPWAPPYVWPPMGGVDSLLELRDALHSKGHLIGVYGSGTFWTQRSLKNDYSQEGRFEKEGLARFMSRAPDGSLKPGACKELRDGYCICSACDWCVETELEQLSAVAAAGLDFFQLFDQNLGANPLTCYSKEHGHPSIPGAHGTESYVKLMRRLNEHLKATGSKLLMGAECAAAEPFVGQLAVNDLRSCFNFWRGMPVPAWQYVFHHRVPNSFMGNQCVIPQVMDCEACPDNILYRTAYHFVAGDLLSVTLRGDGVIDWGAAADWKSTPPNQEHVMTLIKNLNRMRREHPEFLSKGRMLKPLKNIACDSFELRFQKRAPERVPSVLSSSWEAPDGKRAFVMANYLPKSQRVVCDGREIELGPLSAVLLRS